ncbi:SymE family type I addiction module toxin [Flavobacterium tructae]
MYKPPAKVVPYIHLCGNWLQEAGFKPCEGVTVTVMKGTLIIKRGKR